MAVQGALEPASICSPVPWTGRKNYNPNEKSEGHKVQENVIWSQVGTARTFLAFLKQKAQNPYMSERL